MIDSVVALYEAGGLTLVVVVGLGSACVLLYRDLRAMRERLLEAEVSHVKQLVRVWQRLTEARHEAFGHDRESVIENLPSVPPPSDRARLAAERDKAWSLIEQNLNLIAKGRNDE